MPEERNTDTEAAEAKALDIRAQMKAARRRITQGAARALAPVEPRSFAHRDRDPDRDEDDRED